jgi:hypothetical protein
MSGQRPCLYRRFQNSKGFGESESRMRKFFNFCHKAQKLLRYISRDSGDSSDSNYTKYTNYECLDLKEINIIFPSLRDTQEKSFVPRNLGALGAAC